MTPVEIRDLIAEARTDISDAERCEMLGVTPSVGTLLRALRKTTVALAALTTPQEVTGSTSDGYHTFDELYEYRMLYNAHAAHGWFAAGIPVVKSWKHSDGESCFGGGWFIVTATLPAGQVSNHYKAEHWGLFQVPEVDLPPEYDGHTPQIAAERLYAEAAYAASPQEGDARERLAEVVCLALNHRDGGQECEADFVVADAVLAAFPVLSRAAEIRGEHGDG
jgi:hypothetical protein